MTRFTDEYLEIFMQLTRYPNNKGGGHMKFNYEYTKEDCRCEYCLHYKYKRCTVPKCVVLEERVICRAATYNEILNALRLDTSDIGIKYRLQDYMEERYMKKIQFASDAHKKRFESQLNRINKKNKPLVAAVYLLAIDNKVWSQCWQNIQYNSVRIAEKKLRYSGRYGYLYFCAARDLFFGTKTVTLGELTDRDIVEEKTFALVMNAIAIKQYGINAVYVSDTERNE